MTQDKKAYIEFCQSEQNIPLFMKSDWLDAVCTEGVDWDVVLSKNKGGDIVCILVFLIKKKWGLTFLTEPPLSPYCGIWFRDTKGQTSHEQYHFIKSHISSLIHQLPRFHFAHFRFSTLLTDWQPFYWAGFKQTTAYTYRLDLTQTRPLFSQFNQNTQRNIAKAKKHYVVNTEGSFKHFLTINRLVFERQSKQYPIAGSVWQQVEALLSRHNQRRILFAQNTEGVIDAAVYIVYDGQTAYYLAGGSTDKGRQLGAMHLLLSEAIDEAQRLGCTVFDFEGSMLKGVESFFRGFNGVLTPYFKVWKYRNAVFEWLDGVRKVF
ncbi:MAG: peptidoglycan bridge formation glycyltransferase FemA/FemB family protein [Saprospiraceae bacterium]|nr:peptidoglycan bridge formation glycyltransferase FemA/FemB family protein [Saprospiraceae bacterium]